MTQYEIPYPETIADRNHERIPFDPVGNATHRKFLDRVIAKWKTLHPDAQDAQVDVIDEDRRMVILHSASVASVKRDDAGAIRVNLLPEQCKPNKGREVAAAYERKFPGFHLTEFHPYESTALLERMSDRELTARGLVCEYVGCDPWNVKIKEHDHDEGFSLSFLAPFVFKKDADQSKLDGAAVAIGHDGWWSQVDARTGEGDIIPGEPPTFLKSHEYPFGLLGSEECFDRTPYGVGLPEHGGDPYRQMFVDWRESSFLLIGGEGGSGKSVLVNSLLAQLIAQRVELSIIDLENKASDYYWLRPWVTKNHWGCGSITQSAGVLNLLVQEIEKGERAQVWKENALQNWYAAPRWVKEKYPRHLIVVDEYSSLVDEQKVVQNVPDPSKKLPAVFERLFLQQSEYDIQHSVRRLLRTARAQGYMLIVISQTISMQSGLPPAVRDLFGHHAVMGPSPSQAMMKGAFHDLPNIPEVPRRVFDDGVTKGVGRMEPAGGKGIVFKTCYAGVDGMSDTERLARALVERIGLPDDVDESRFLGTLRPPSEDHPMDAEYMRFLTDRISLSEEDAIRSDSTLAELKRAWDESKSNFGDGDPVSPQPAATGLDDGREPSAPTRSAGITGVVPSGGLLDARELARVMEGRG